MRSLRQKRLFDLAVTLPALAALGPTMLLVAGAVRVRMGSPVLFRQVRPGLREKAFTVYKFRTMTLERDAEGRLLPDEQRVTALGSFLRKTSLDEFPAFFSVVAGDMSLVGPRPLLERYLPYYTERERLRHEVPPGITGLAQINGRNDLPWDQRLAMDVWYVENGSLALDLKILALTVFKVFRGSGVQVAPATVMQDLDVERSHRA